MILSVGHSALFATERVSAVPRKGKPGRAVGESCPWRTWACLIKERILAPRDLPASTGGSRSSPGVPLDSPGASSSPAPGSQTAAQRLPNVGLF